MPIYEYRCDKGHTFEVMQRMSDDPVAECERCGAPVKRVFHPVAVHFKGSGFYNTDYGKKKRGKPGDKDDSKSTETKSESKSESSSSSSSKAGSSKSDSGKSSSSSTGSKSASG